MQGPGAPQLPRAWGSPARLSSAGSGGLPKAMSTQLSGLKGNCAFGLGDDKPSFGFIRFKSRVTVGHTQSAFLTLFYASGSGRPTAGEQGPCVGNARLPHTQAFVAAVRRH